MEEKAAFMEWQGIEYGYGGESCLRQADGALPEEQITCLLGPAGCGKTTLLKILAGRLKPQKGRVLRQGAPLSREMKRKTAGIFPDSRMIDWLKIGVQFKLLLLLRGDRGQVALDRMEWALGQVEMQGCEEKFPDQLSEGEYKRVLLARALLLGPSLLILDGILQNADQALYQRLWRRLKEWQEQSQATVLYASSRPGEALNGAHQVLLMREGRIVQAGAPDQLFSDVQSHFAAAFLKRCNILRGTVTGMGKNKAVLDMEGISLPCLPKRPLALGEEAGLCVDQAELKYGLRPRGKIFLSGVVRKYKLGPEGETVQIELDGGKILTAFCDRENDCPVGSRVFLWWDMEKAEVVSWDNSVQ